jgi:hypothetical protein
MPPKARPLTEEILEALLDPKVVEALAKALSPYIALSIDEAMGKRLEQLTSTVKGVQAENVRLGRRLDEAAAETTRLKETIVSQAVRLDELESYSRSDNIIIRGLPEDTAAERATNAATLDDRIAESHGAVEKTVLTFLNDKLGVQATPQDISIAHRLKPGPKDKVRPVVVRFVNRKMRNDVLGAKGQLKDSTFFVSEHLTKSASQLFFEARKLLREKKIAGAWTRNGQIVVKFVSTDRGRVVKNVQELMSTNGQR